MKSFYTSFTPATGEIAFKPRIRPASDFEIKRKSRISWREWLRRLWNYDPVAMQAEMLRYVWQYRPRMKRTLIDLLSVPITFGAIRNVATVLVGDHERIYQLSETEFWK